MRKRIGTSGFTYIELMAALAVIMVLAAATIPVYRWNEKRRRENHLRVHLQTIRGAIDQYNRYVQEGLIVPQDVQQCASPENLRTCYPLTLEDLVEGVEVGDPESSESETVIFLRRIPVDPFTEEARWGLRSYQDDWDSQSWGGENVYDVYSLSRLQALDGTYYRDW
jgi:general secretion pathway protein G